MTVKRNLFVIMLVTGHPLAIYFVACLLASLQCTFCTPPLARRWRLASHPRGDQLLMLFGSLILLLNFPLNLLAKDKEVVAKDYIALSQKLSALRVEVENLNANLEDERKNYKTQLNSYSLQKAELEATLRKEEIRKEQIQLKVPTLKKALTKNKQGNLDLKPLVFTYSDKLSSVIEGHLPFKKEERLSHVIKIRNDLERGNINSHQALSRLWSAFEDENRLSRENQLSRETISMNGTSYLAEVVHLGSVKIFFRLENGIYGMGIPSHLNSGSKVQKPSDDQWKFVPLKEKSQILASKKLFSGIKKQIKTGEYLVPLRIE